MKTVRGPKRQQRAVIVLAAGFDEEEVVACLTRLRAAGISSSLVSLSAGVVEGAHGLVVYPDTSLERELTLSPPRLLVLPGGSACAAALMADPRVHQLISNTAQGGGRIAVTSLGLPMVSRAVLWQSDVSASLVPQGDLELGTFADRLTRGVVEPRADRP